MLSARRPLPRSGGTKLTFFIGLLFLLYSFKTHGFSKLEGVILAVFFLLWLLINYWRSNYYTNRENEFLNILAYHARAYSVFIIVVVGFYVLFPISVPGKKKILLFAIGFPVLEITFNYLLHRFLNRLKNTKNVKYALIAGTGSMAKKVETQLMLQNVNGYKIRGFINCAKHDECIVEQHKVIGSLHNINDFLMENAVDEIVIALPGKPIQKIQNILSTADYHGIRVKYIPDYEDLFGGDYQITRFGEINALSIHKSPVDSSMASFAKNCFDKLFAAVTLLLLSPLFLLIALLIKLESRGPVFYCPVRIGKGGRPFKLYKFRSMRENDASSGGTLSTAKDDPRITPLGKKLRKYSLDELPQFMNVLQGHMSVVGPRPHRRYLNQQLQECVTRYMIRHYVKPGITGWAQVNGWRGPTDTDEQKRQRTLHDLWYVKHWSFWLDVKIILLTILGKKTRQGAF
jgi:putative colanic acid biosynthesis UDP-glucose lipid carrier transferase